jgi:DNA-binding response OmpR family regulator
MSTLLVAEDDPDILAMIAGKLMREGHHVITAADGPTALAEARRVVPDAVVLDMGMPGLTGLDICRALRADLATAAIPVIMVTAQAQEADIERGFSAGADDYLTKPFSLRDLTGRVAELLAAEPVAGAVDAPKGDVHELDGPTREAFNYVTSRTGVVVLSALRHGPKRVSELQRPVADLPDADFARKFRALERDGWIRPHPEAEAGEDRRYELTDAGKQIARRMTELLDWIERHMPATLLAQRRYDRTH